MTTKDGMTHYHAAFFGAGTGSDAGADSASMFSGDLRGIPADLIPYLEEADAPDDQPDIDIAALTGNADQSSTSRLRNSSQGSDTDQDAERDEALRALVENSLLVGPDPTILAELDGEFDDEFADDADQEQRERSEHQAALDQAADGVELDAEVERIYQGIVARAPEHSVQPSLERVTTALDILGDPQNSYPSVHITGTNGKTSTARMIDSMLTAFGMRVGRFTSPHLIDVRERISIEGEPISRDAFISAWRDVEPYIGMVDAQSQADGGPAMSFFEVFTVMAYAAFADHPVDAAVVEVGMGGTWDATNTIDAGVAVITPIALDHTKWLGSSITEIAQEKAGIIKPGQIVVIAKQPEEVLDILLARAREVDAIVRLEGRDFEVASRQLGVGGQMVTVRTPSAVYEDVFVPLFGEHQAHNAAAAIVATESFMGGRGLDPQIVERGMMSATSPGRLQVVRHSPTILVDAAHNPAGAAVLADAITESFDLAHTVGVYSAMGDKDVEGVLAELEPVLEHLVITRMPGERAADAEELREIAEDVFGADRVDVRSDLAEAVDRAAELAEASTAPSDRAGVVVFGSVVLAGQMLALAGKRP
ncbi:Mur ligase family protein [Schaalia vaccimaxillae]|uniref:bifunctional folylpolyglutamate synthase/dihydrofolate synthase n=1 Tax=Schaalia vaccimaxillae TaxID=183916 RepID=UPI0003B4D83F